jgi:hypothetical protein
MKKYQDYVIKDGKFIGRFEEMYRDFDDPWVQTANEENASEKVAGLNVIKQLNLNTVVEFGSGLGVYTNQISKIYDNVVGIELSETAIEKAKKRYPHLMFRQGEFPDFDYLLEAQPDCIVMAEITWYILPRLEEFLNFMKVKLPETWLLHTLMTYPPETQSYGKEYFSDLSAIRKYFGMNYLEWGEVAQPEMNGGARTYFVGRFASLSGA